MTNRYQPLPERCCMRCRFGKLMYNERIRCQNGRSEYFNERMGKRDQCPAFEGERRK